MADKTWLQSRTYPSLNSQDTVTRFRDYVVIVAGGASGIGRATVERFANDGATVYAVDKNIQSKEELETLSRVKCLQLDVSDSKRCQQVVKDIAGNHGGLVHTLVNSAVYFGSKGLNSTDEDWERSCQVNITGCANMVKAVVPFMKSGEGCSIVNLSSVSGFRCQPNRWTYSATKGAVSSMTRCMALDLGVSLGIRVNAVVPSWAWTPEVAKAAGNDRVDGEKRWHNFFILDRLGEVEEVAAVVTFLASKDAAYVTGADIPVCGGYLAMGPEQKGQQSSFAGSTD